MRKKHFLLFSFLFFISFQIFSQTEQHPHALSWRWTWYNFQYPITNDFNSADYTTGGELNYGRYLNRWLNLAIPLKVAKVELPLNEEGATDDGEMIGSLDALLHFNILKSGSTFNPYLLGGVGVMRELENEKNTNAEFPVGIGFNVKLANRIYASAETQYRFDVNDNRNQLIHALGIKFDFGGKDEDEVEEIVIKDRDMDGITDDEDECPTEVGTRAMNGCPDNDGDGVANHLDECPDIVGLKDNKGCPSEDTDGDGVKNDVDRCPDVAGSEYTKGCPDLDGDGIADSDDMCPSQTGLPENKGCPDTDGDGLADPFDKCPNTAGPKTNEGCPELKPKEKEVLDFALQNIEFETANAQLTAGSKSILDEIVGIMNNHPASKLRIKGHTDSIGSAENNRKLSERRAKACYDYLVGKRIEKGRISYEGLGEKEPIADNRFAPGREKNRRVEFDIYFD